MLAAELATARGLGVRVYVRADARAASQVTKCASATALRGGYFYSVKFTLPERVWDAGGGDLARAATASFRLTPTTRKFRKPDEGLVSISVPTPF